MGQGPGGEDGGSYEGLLGPAWRERKKRDARGGYANAPHKRKRKRKDLN